MEQQQQTQPQPPPLVRDIHNVVSSYQGQEIMKKLFGDNSQFISASIVLLPTLFYLMYVLMRNDTSESERHWAQGLLGFIVGIYIPGPRYRGAMANKNTPPNRTGPEIV
jgi:hypothetical protein